MINIKKIFEYSRQLSRYFSASLIPMLLNLMINPLVALNMSPEDFAITGYFTSFSTLLTPIISFYLIHYYNKRYFELDEKGREYLTIMLFKALIFFSFAVTIVCLFALIIYIKLSTNISIPAFPYLYIAVMTIPFTGIYNLELARYKMERKSRQYMNLSLVKGIVLTIGIILFVVIIKYGAFGKLLAPLLVEVGFFCYLVYKHRDIWGTKTTISDIKPMI